MPQVLFLFGAGASHGSDTAGVPPLTATLFDDLQGCGFESWRSIGATEAAVFRADFERGMARIEELDEYKLPQLQKDLAAFFFSFAARPTSLYAALAKRIPVDGNSHVTCATLNYERLLTMALTANGIACMLRTAKEVPIFSTGGTAVELCAPHGCCNFFFPESVAYARANMLQISGTKVHFNAPTLEVVDEWSEFHYRMLTSALPPMISYINAKKGTMTGGPFVENQRERFAMHASHADTIVVIGTRVRTQDVHVWKPLEAATGRIVYCAGDRGAKEYSEWREGNDARKSDLVLTGRFRDRLADIFAVLGW
jgi:hypothetical protein